LANWAFELMMQMEGRDEHERDPAVAEALAAVYERAGELPGGGYTVFSIEVERLYMGDFIDDDETAAQTVMQSPLADFLIEGTTLERYRGNEAHITIPSLVTVIGDAAFIVLPGGTSPESVTIPSSVMTIGERAFQNCAYMTSVTFNSPSSVSVIGDDAFLGCSSLLSIDIPSSVRRIGDGAFGNCQSLTSIVIPSSVTAIGDYAFDSCYSLTSVTLSRSTRVGNRAFEAGAQLHYRD
jgi:hypothetical protein